MSTLQNISTMLRSHGLRVTPQRLAIAELVLSKASHFTARSTHDTLITTHPAISMNTVYMTLSQFESSGLLNHFEVNGNTVFDSNTVAHDHACCSRCKAIIDLPHHKNIPPQMPDALSLWQIKNEQRIWSGICPSCSGSLQ
ncbi:MAG: Fur family transcriptional regulator [Mariprofundus sp.]|nr:Fur family transcriptional regulator [Mariprofundus sp.]